MAPELEPLRAAVAAATGLDLGALASGRLPGLAAELYRLADALRSTAAHWTVLAQREGAFALGSDPTGAKQLARSTGSSVRSLRADTSLGRALDAAPVLAEAARAAEVSRETASVVGSVVQHPAFAAHGGDLVDRVKGKGPGEARIEVEQWRREHADAEGPEQRSDDPRAKTYLRFTPRGDGLVGVEGLLTELDARVVQNRLQALVPAAADGASPGHSFARRAADALVTLASAPAGAGPTGPRQGGTTLLVGFLYEELLQRAGRPVTTFTGEVLSSDELERLLCEADVHPVILSSKGQALFLGSAVRWAPHEHWLALAARDGGCRWDDCDAPPEQCVVHHEPPMPGGATDITKEVLLCRHRHHFERHRRGTTAVLDPITATYSVTTPDGQTFTTNRAACTSEWPPPESDVALTSDLLPANIQPYGCTFGAVGCGGRPHLPRPRRLDAP